MHNLTRAAVSLITNKATRIVCLFLVAGLTLLCAAAGRAQGDFILALAGIPGTDIDFAPTPAFKSGFAICTRQTILALATANAVCPNGSPALNQATIRAVIGGRKSSRAA